ncbi:hypothetical protein FO519_010085, partial [Halicephalobus sp. NKZ332]
TLEKLQNTRNRIFTKYNELLQEITQYFISTQLTKDYELVQQQYYQIGAYKEKAQRYKKQLKEFKAEWEKLEKEVDADRSISTEMKKVFEAEMQTPTTMPEIDNVLNSIEELIIDITFKKSQWEEQKELLKKNITPQSNTLPPAPLDIVSDEKILIKTFSGDYRKYRGFMEDWKATVHINPKYGPGQKVQLLKSRLRDQALETVKCYNRPEDYQIALKTLEERYDKPEKARMLLRSDLRKPFTQKDDYRAVRKMFDNFQYTLYLLESYGADTETEETREALDKKLPESILTGINLRRSMWPTDRPFTVKDRRKIVEQLLQDTEDVKTIIELADREGEAYTYATTTAKTTKMTSERTKTLQCPFCEGSHKPEECTRCKTPNERKAAAKEKKLCTRCLKPNHYATNCRSRIQCEHCKRNNHLTALCFKKT